MVGDRDGARWIFCPLCKPVPTAQEGWSEAPTPLRAKTVIQPARLRPIQQ